MDQYKKIEVKGLTHIYHPAIKGGYKYYTICGNIYPNEDNVKLTDREITCKKCAEYIRDKFIILVKIPPFIQGEYCSSSCDLFRKLKCGEYYCAMGWGRLAGGTLYPGGDCKRKQKEYIAKIGEEIFGR